MKTCSDYANSPRFDEARHEFEQLERDPGATPRQRARAYRNMMKAHRALRNEATGQAKRQTKVWN